MKLSYSTFNLKIETTTYVLNDWKKFLSDDDQTNLIRVQLPTSCDKRANGKLSWAEMASWTEFLGDEAELAASVRELRLQEDTWKAGSAGTTLRQHAHAWRHDGGSRLGDDLRPWHWVTQSEARFQSISTINIVITRFFYIRFRV